LRDGQADQVTLDGVQEPAVGHAAGVDLVGVVVEAADAALLRVQPAPVVAVDAAETKEFRVIGKGKGAVPAFRRGAGSERGSGASPLLTRCLRAGAAAGKEAGGGCAQASGRRAERCQRSRRGSDPNPSLIDPSPHSPSTSPLRSSRQRRLSPMLESTPSLALAWGAGVLTFLSPCVLPLVPSYLALIGAAGAGTEARDLRVSRFNKIGRAHV